MDNLLKNAPYRNEGVGKRKLVDEKHLLLMQAALKPGQMVPRHCADSNVHIVVLQGEIIVTLGESPTTATAGSLIPVPYGTIMDIANKGLENATFLIFKTPHPAEIREPAPI